MKTLIAIGVTLALGVKISHGPFTLDGVPYPDKASCLAAAEAQATDSPIFCEQKVAVVGDCSDVPMPTAIVDAEGFTVQEPLIAVACPGETSYQLLQNDWVPAPYDARRPARCHVLEPKELLSCNPPETPMDIDPDGPWLPEIPDEKDLEIEAPHRGL